MIISGQHINVRTGNRLLGVQITPTNHNFLKAEYIVRAISIWTMTILF